MKRFKTNLSNYRLSSMEMGKLYPVQVQEVLPGDSFRLSTSALVRLSPLVSPVMHPVTVRIHHWFVPNRVVWDGWEDFITGEDVDSVIPNITNTADSKNLTDYMGVPPVEGLEINALPVWAYNKIFNEFYRDQDLVDEVDQASNLVQNVAWRKDYFTAARPWPQKGPDIVLPIGETAPVIADDVDPTRWIKPSSGLEPAPVGIVELDRSLNVPIGSNSGPAQPNLIADLSETTGVTAVEFREFFALQRYAEARARYGSRYTEYLRYLGITPRDSRLQRPEYLGGGKSTIQFSEVLQTAGDDLGAEQTPVGTLRGHGISALRSKGVRRFFEEHGHIISLVSVVPKSIYQDGVNRNWLRQDKEDYFQKELQSIGQQPVKLGEVYAENPSNIHDIFGYQDRYSDYLTCPSGVSGDFRELLDYWHLARKFESEPALNKEFIDCVPTKRIFAEQTENPLWVMVNNSVVARRMVKKTSIGKLL